MEASGSNLPRLLINGRIPAGGLNGLGVDFGFTGQLKEKIDDIALAMIDKIKKHEEVYLKNLNEKFSSFDDSKSLKDELLEKNGVTAITGATITTRAVVKSIQEGIEKLNKVIELKPVAEHAGVPE